nr:MAG TPA: hypothetical protein [Caudoviricetes sp.]
MMLMVMIKKVLALIGIKMYILILLIFIFGLTF